MAIIVIIMASPVTLPAIITTIAGYLALAGTVLGGGSQITITGEQ
jgi:hypothetical protein